MAQAPAELPDTFPRLLLYHAQWRDKHPALREKDLGIWQTWTWSQVADEVRKLAERASIATKEIAALISSIQNGVSEAVKAMGRGGQEVEAGYGLAAEAGRALDDILERAQIVGKQVNQISAAAEELNALSGNMVSVIQQISKTIDENAAAAETMAESSSLVSGAIENLGGVAEENSASAEEVSASVEEMSAGVEEVLASAQSLAEMSEGLEKSVATFKTHDN
jgi:methyl-accepting chemotaxis protein